MLSLHRHPDHAEYRAFLDHSADYACVFTPDGRIHYANPALERTLAVAAGSLEGTSFDDLIVRDATFHVDAIAATVRAHGTWQGMGQYRRERGPLIVQLTVFAVGDRFLGAMAHDVSVQLQVERDRIAVQEQIIAMQMQTLEELASPILPIADDVIIIPLIGTIDAARAQTIVETTLQGVYTHRARIVIMDITGVPVVDTEVANALIHTAQAINLLGAQVMISGIGAEMAQTLVGLGIALDFVQTSGSLQHAIKAAFSGRI